MNNINEMKVTFTLDKMTTILQGEKIVIEGKELNNLIIGHTSLTRKRLELLKSEKRFTEEVSDSPEDQKNKKIPLVFHGSN
jgi:hypothetical protein